MPLLPDPDEPGLWVNDDIKPGEPALHALIIGVSRYDYLENGAKAAEETFGLGQLAVSALTALRFFGWLRHDYRSNGWPLARVRLLLSPQKARAGTAFVDELAGCDAQIVDHAIEATFDNCKLAVANWYGEMKDLASPSTARSLFFFSGHGVQIVTNNQLLIPSDYGRKRGSTDEAIRTQNLFDSLPSLPRVPSHVMLVDACRNDIDKLRGVSGTNVIDQGNTLGDANLELRVLRATASGRQAYQPTSPGGMSLFGQALLEGLSAKPNPKLGEAPIKVSTRGTVHTIEITDLQVYMNDRINALIKVANESVSQTVRSDGSQSAAQLVDVTELATAPASSIAETTTFVEEVAFHPGPSHAGLPKGGHRLGSKRPVKKSAAAPKAKKKVVRPGAWFEARYAAPGRAPATPVTDDLGAEAFSTPWAQMTISGLSTDLSLHRDAVELISVARSEDRGDIHGIRLRLRLMEIANDPVGHTLTMVTLDHRSFRAVLPADMTRPCYQIEIDRIDVSYIRFAVYLSPDKDGAIAPVALAWEKMRALAASAAVPTLEKHLKSVIAPCLSKDADTARAAPTFSPLAATVAVALSLRAHRLDLLGDWTRNLAQWFPTIPDSVVFWAEQRRRQNGGVLEAGLAIWFVTELSSRGIPFTCDALGLAANLLADIVRQGISPPSAMKDQADRLKTDIDKAILCLRDDGLFCTYVGLPAMPPPDLRLGPPAALKKSAKVKKVAGPTVKRVSKAKGPNRE